MESKAKNKLEHLNSLTALNFVDDEQIKEGFKKLYLATHAGETEEDANNFYEREANYFKRIVFANRDLQQCTMFSLYGCFMDIVVNGLSFDPSANLVAIELRNFNAGTEQNPKWEKRASNKISPYGELTLRIKFGQVKYIDTPVIVFEGDVYKKGYSAEGRQYIIYESGFPRSKNIVGGFVKVVRPDGSYDFPDMDANDIERLKTYSERNNRTTKKANALYASNDGQIDPGFLKAKLIRHAFKAFPKCTILGTHSSFDEDIDPDAQVYNVPTPDENIDHVQKADPGSIAFLNPEPESAKSFSVHEAMNHNHDKFPSQNGTGKKSLTVSFDSDEF